MKKLTSSLSFGLVVLSLSGLVACGQSSQSPLPPSIDVPAAESPATSAKPTATPQPSQAAKPTAPPPVQPQPATGLTSGNYCYELKSKTLSAQAKVMVNRQNQVSGNFNGTVHNEAAGYFTSYQQTFQGPLTGNQAKLEVKTKIEYDNQTAQETWTITPKTLKTRNDTLQTMDCVKFGQIATKSAPSPTVPSRSKPTNKRISFAKGATSAVVKNSVVRAERNTYLLNAGKGQTMNIRITSLEDNAVFQVMSPDGTVIATETKSLQETLPAKGDYQISVGGTRGNATYEMTISVK
ncbi:hypothetical protein IQ266_19435 [filamentous cyanobacterium LEGE 11480]|uniref:Uncharacterized protein n=1 Tax=Romeriopsis navalis LEGE 11480 TaxID=2777977 RepID=A0A928VSU5_9CYAN|nr:hypothetical protein [Romeriopsis navalis]MBE9031912.1 hypothetical protein [Romeriopsis navalis LEGE 11480]